MVLESECPLLGGSVFFNFSIFLLLIAFFFFWYFRGSFFSFLSLVFEFWKFWKWFWNQNAHFGGGVCFLQLFYFLAPYSIFGFFGTLGGLFLVFWVWFLSFENFENGFGIRMPTFGGVCFLQLFYFLAPYSIFGFFGTLGGLFLVFWVWFLSFENFENGFGIRMPTFGGGLFSSTFLFSCSL